MLELTVRELAATDVPLVLSSWKQSFLDITDAQPHGHTQLGRMARVAYFEGQERVIRSLWRRSSTIVACHPEYPDQVFGYCCWTAPDILHYVYVRHPWRKMGVATRLLGAAFPGFKQQPLLYSHYTHHMHYRAGGWLGHYNPYVLYGLVGSQ